MLEILCIEPAARGAGTPVRDSDGARVGTVTDVDGDTRYVAVHPDAPVDTLDALDWDADGDREPLPRRLVADDGDTVRLVV